jgi:hypothetical protein
MELNRASFAAILKHPAPSAVLSGEIIAGRYVQLAVERNLDDNAQERGLHFATEIAGKVLRFVETVCTHQNE